MSNRSERVQVQGPNGRKTWVSRATAESQSAKDFGYVLVDDLYQAVPDLTQEKRKPGRPTKTESNAN